MYWPPLTIRVMDCRNFGRQVLVGTATVTSLSSYLYVSREERLRRQEEARLKEERLALLNEKDKDKDKKSANGGKSGRGWVNIGGLYNFSVCLEHVVNDQ